MCFRSFTGVLVISQAAYFRKLDNAKKEAEECGDYELGKEIKRKKFKYMFYTIFTVVCWVWILYKKGMLF